MGIEGSTRASGDEQALRKATVGQNLDIMGVFIDAGVTDRGESLASATNVGCKAAVKFLLEQKKREGVVRTA